MNKEIEALRREFNLKLNELEKKHVANQRDPAFTFVMRTDETDTDEEFFVFNGKDVQWID